MYFLCVLLKSSVFSVLYLGRVGFLHLHINIKSSPYPTKVVMT